MTFCSAARPCRTSRPAGRSRDFILPSASGEESLITVVISRPRSRSSTRAQRAAADGRPATRRHPRPGAGSANASRATLRAQRIRITAVSG